MVSALLLAVAALLWPAGARRRPAGTPRGTGFFGIAVAGGATPGSVAAGSALARMQTRVDAPAGSAMLPGPVPLALAMGAGCCVALVSFLAAGLAGLTAAAMVLATCWLLLRQEFAERRQRRALVDILAALRILGRELQAGADPGLAAANGAAVASGEGAVVLSALTQLTRTDDRSVGGGLRNGVRDDAPARSVRVQVLARLRAGWLLTKWHGLAFTPLVTALAQDLSEQLAAGSERAGQVAGPRTSGYVMALLPLLGIALGVGMGAEPIRVLTNQGIGSVLLLVGVGLTCAGLLWSARIVRP